jgi:hypothetical protein
VNHEERFGEFDNLFSILLFRLIARWMIPRANARKNVLSFEGGNRHNLHQGRVAQLAEQLTLNQ